MPPSRNRRLDAVGGALVLLRVATDVDAVRIEADMTSLPAVVEVLDLSGPWDYQVRVRFGGQPELYAVVNALRALAGVTAIETRTVLREVLAR